MLSMLMQVMIVSNKDIRLDRNPNKEWYEMPLFYKLVCKKMANFSVIKYDSKILYVELPKLSRCIITT